MDWKNYIKTNSELTSTGCWQWLKCTDDYGYGRCITNHPTRNNESAHRVSYRAFNGEIAHAEVVNHYCENPACVNPEHLYIEEPVQLVVNNNTTGHIFTPLGRHNSIKEASDAHKISTATLYARFKAEPDVYYKTQRPPLSKC